MTDAEWEVLEPLVTPNTRRERPRRHPLRRILNAILYLVRSGCAWQQAPRDLPPWKTVFHYFGKWRLDGAWERLRMTLRQTPRVQVGRDPQPSAGIIDRQSVKTTGVGGERSFDSGRQVKGHQRHLLVDTEGLVLTVTVHSADIMDRDGVKWLLPHGSHGSHDDIRTRFPRLQHVWLDAGYNGKDKGKDWIERTLGWSAEIVAHPPQRKKVWAPTGIPPEQIDWAKYG